MIPVLSRTASFYCPNCGLTETVRVPSGPVSRMHTCPKLFSLTAPMLEQGTAAKVEARLRDDYVNGETVQTSPEDGRPYMSVVTTRDNGMDTVVFAPTATAKAQELD